MSTITKQFTKEQLVDRAKYGIERYTKAAVGFPRHMDVAMDLELARIALASLEAEAVAYTDAEELRFPHATSDMWPVPLGHGMDLPLFAAPPALLEITEDMALAYHHAFTDGAIGSSELEEIMTGLRAAFANVAAPPAPVSVPDEHNSVIAEQLAHVLSGMDVTDHQRAIINCAVDRLNKNAEVIQQKPAYSEVPEALGYQGAKELFNYLMTEEETNATVNGWNACRAAMLQGADGNSPDGWVACSERMPESGDYLVTDGRDCDVQMYNGEQFIPGFVWEDEITHWMPLPAAPQQEIKP